MLLQIQPGIVPALGQALIPVGEEGAALVDDIPLHGHIQQRALRADALAVDDVEFRHPEGRGHLVLDHLDLRPVADDFGSVLQRLALAHIQAHGGIELQRPAAGRRLRIAVHDADLFPQLVDEHRHAAGLVDDARQLPQRLAHQPGLQAHEGIAHLAVDFRLRHQGRHRVDDHHVQRAAAHQRLGDLQRLLAGIRLGHIQLVDIHAQLLRVQGIQRVLRVHKGGDAAGLLRLRHHVQRHRGLTGGFRPVDLHDPAPGNAAHAQRRVQRQAAGGDHRDIPVHRVGAQLHHGALAELLVQIGQRVLQRLELFLLNAAAFRSGSFFGFCGFLRCHMQILQFKIRNSSFTVIPAAESFPAVP